MNWNNGPSAEGRSSGTPERLLILLISLLTGEKTEIQLTLARFWKEEPFPLAVGNEANRFAFAANFYPW